jgi:hypothetical protein
MNDRQRLEAIVAVVCRYLPPDGISREEAMSQIISLVDPLPEQEQWDTSDMAHRPGGLSVEQPVKSYTGGVPQYATDAPKREWQGLTDVEIAAYSDMFNGIRLVRGIEALLKERNT